MTDTILWNTGVDDLRRPLPPGHVDPNWRLIQGPGFSFTDHWQKVYVLTNQQMGNYFGTTDSMWVWADALAAGKSGVDFVFETRFYIGADPSQYWFEIRGSWGTDNFGHLTIDRQPLPAGSYTGEVSLPSGVQAANYQQPHDFTISSQPLQLGTGWHTFEVWAQNEGMPDDPISNPAGINVSALRFDLHEMRRPGPPHTPVSWLRRLFG